MTLRVVVDATPIPGQRAGAGAYVTELLRAMASEDLDLGVFVNTRDMEEFRELLPDAKLYGMGMRSRPMRIAWAHFVLPRIVNRLRPDVFHGPHYTLPNGLRSPGVVTFHDPTFFTHPELHERAKVAYFTRAARTGIERATRVIAVSSYAGRGAVEHGGARPENVDVVYEGVDIDRYTPGNAPAAQPYILFVGTLEPRKDVPTLIDAYARLDGDHDLVLCGQPGWGISAIEDAIGRSGRAAKIRRTGYVEEAEKVALYRGASLFVYPSIAEGFGLPVLEAMACGVPVVTTSGSAPEEVAGEAAMLVPPRDSEAVRKTMQRVLTDGSLRGDLVTKGLERAKGFTWERAAKETLDVWRRAAAAT